MKKNIKETAAGGSMGGGSIANVPGGSGRQDTPMRLKDFMMNFFKNTQNRTQFKPVSKMIPTSFKKINEDFTDISSAVSHLKNLETSATDERSTVTYGVEDDDGNMMKVTVPHEQGEEFEARLSKEMAAIEDFKKTGHKGRNSSMAELLFDLKDEFSVIDVEFPTIPSDAIYNADKISHGVEEDDDNPMGDDSMGDKEGGLGDMGDDNPMGDDSMGDDSMGGDNPMGDKEGGLGDMGDDNSMGDDDGFGDDDSVEDFDDKPSENNPESILQSVMDMLRANAEAEKAKADAEAEKARAKQAEFSAIASRQEMAKQEELVGVEAEMDAQKEKEKQAKEMANIARHNYNKAKGAFGETFSPLTKVILELDSNDTVGSLRKQEMAIRDKYKVMPEDDEETKQYKQDQYKLARRELQIKKKAAIGNDKYNQALKAKQDAQNQQTNQNVNQQPNGAPQ